MDRFDSCALCTHPVMQSIFCRLAAAMVKTGNPILTPLAREICGGQQEQQQEEPSEDYLLSSNEASEEGEVVTDNDSLFGGLQCTRPYACPFPFRQRGVV